MRRLVLASVCILMGIGAVTVVQDAYAQVFVEPELGARFLTKDAGDWLSTGVCLGGTVGYNVVPALAVIGHVDFGFHGPAEDIEDFVDGGGSLALLAGLRVIPLAATADLPFQPYIEGSFGRAGIAWSYTDAGEFVTGDDSDGIGAWTAVIGGGGDIRVSDMISLGAGVRYYIMMWDDETVEGHDYPDFEGSSVQVVGHLGIHF